MSLRDAINVSFALQRDFFFTTVIDIKVKSKLLNKGTVFVQYLIQLLLEENNARSY